LTDAERGRLSGFPKEIPAEDLYVHFTLTGRDRAAVPIKSAPSNRLGFALSLCAVRYLGFCPDDLSGCPENALWYVSQQLGLTPEALAGYPEREQTRTDHLKRIYAHLGYRRPLAGDLREFFRWLVERALEHDDPALLVRLAAEKLKAERVVRPGVSRLERMVAAARERTDAETYRALSPILADETRTRLDALLEVDRTLNAWCELPVGNLSGRCPPSRVGLLPDPEGKGTDSSWLMWTPSSPHFTLRLTTSATPIRQKSDPAPKPPSPKARSSPSPSSPGGRGLPASGTSTATLRPTCSMPSLPCPLARSSTAWCAPVPSSSRLSSCTW
jgi:hypothetical protein